MTYFQEYCYNKTVEFSEWITKKYIEWRGNAIGRQRSISSFAKYIGVTQQAMSDWMNGSIPKRHETITKLAAHLGPEVYDVLGLPRQNILPIDHLPPNLQRQLQAAISEVESELSARGLVGDSPEAIEIVTRIFELHGFKFTHTTKT